MAKFTFEDILYSRKKQQEIFDFDKLIGPGIYNLLYESDLQKLYNISTSIKYSAELKKKYAAINDILRPRGFAPFHRGTNRAVFKHYENPNILIKVPIDLAGCSDGIMEFKNQNLLKPFVTKVFDVHPSGVSVHERVMPITSYADFARFAYDYFQLVSHVFLGRYVMDDIGEGSFMNWGFRYGFGLVLLDFPYLYELDYQRLVCRTVLPSGEICCGEIDYDDGFNHLICKKCGHVYDAKTIGKFIQDYKINVIKEDEVNMGTFKRKLIVMRGNTIIEEFGTTHMESDVIVPKEQFDKVNKLRENSKPINKVPKFKLTQKKSQPDEVKETQNVVVNKPTEEKEQQQNTNEKTISLVEKYLEDHVQAESPKQENLVINESVEQIEEDSIEVKQEETPVEVEEQPNTETEDESVDVDVNIDDQDDASDTQFQLNEENIEEEVEQEESVEEDKKEKTKLDLAIEEFVKAGLDEKFLRYISTLRQFDIKTMQAISEIVKDNAERNFPVNQQKDVYLKYMNAANKISTIILEEKEKIMDPQQFEIEKANNNVVIQSEEDTFNHYCQVIDDWFKADGDPHDDGMPGIPESGNITFEQLCSGIKAALSGTLDEELGHPNQPPMVANKDKFVDKVVQTVVNANMDYMRKWTCDCQ